MEYNKHNLKVYENSRYVGKWKNGIFYSDDKGGNEMNYFVFEFGDREGYHEFDTKEEAVKFITENGCCDDFTVIEGRELKPTIELK